MNMFCYIKVSTCCVMLVAFPTFQKCYANSIVHIIYDKDKNIDITKSKVSANLFKDDISYRTSISM